MFKRFLYFFFIALALVGCTHPSPQGEIESPQLRTEKPRIIGAMRNVMWKGELFARIKLDTLSNWENLYALGPIEGLKGEFAVYNGRGYRSSVVDGRVVVTETREIEAPFTGYGYVRDWQSVPLPDSVKTTAALDAWLDAHVEPNGEPFFFAIDALIENAVYHVMDLPDGTVVDSPDVAHELGRKFFDFSGRADLLGFFGRNYKGIFTHHDTFTHIHLLAADRSVLGHLDTLLLSNEGHSIRLPSDIALMK
ncbi:MAG: alpha-acetolactate decarboxylase [Flavobacteriales bacterium]